MLAESFDWRATQWALTIYGIVIWVLIVLALPETLKARKNIVFEAEVADVEERPTLSRVSTRESVKQRSGKYAKILRILFVDPLSVLGYLRFPLVALCVYYAAVTFGSLYILNISIQYSYERQPYDFSTLIIGLLYIPNSIGYITASVFGGKWMDKIMAREARKKQNHGEALVLLPEDRMRENAWLGAFLYPAALIIYGWTTGSGVIWVVPVSFRIPVHLVISYNVTQMQEPNRLTCGILDDIKLLLWYWKHADILALDYHAHRISTSPVQFWDSCEQLCPQYLLLYWSYCRSPTDQCHRQWLVIHNIGPVGFVLWHCCHMGLQTFWATLAGKYGPKAYLVRRNHMRSIFA